MGTMPGQVTEPPRLNITISRRLNERLLAAARRLDQSVAAYVRLALVEKLDRDGD